MDDRRIGLASIGSASLTPDGRDAAVPVPDSRTCADDHHANLQPAPSGTVSAESASGGQDALVNTLGSVGEDTMGPYYHYSFLDEDRSDLTVVHPGLVVAPKGERILLRGRLLDSEGDPVVDAVLEFWQANAAGVFRTPRTLLDPGLDPYFDGFARLITTDVPFELRTVKPGAGAIGTRAPHVTLTIFSDGVTRLVTQVFFEGESGNARDPLLESLPEALRARLVAQRSGADDGAAIYEIDIIMRGERETPFFDDLTS